MTIRRLLLLACAIGVAAPIPSDPSPCQLGEDRRGDGDADVDTDVDTDADSDADGDGDADQGPCPVCIDTTEFNNPACTTTCSDAAPCESGFARGSCRTVVDNREGRTISACVTGSEPPYTPAGPSCSSDSDCLAYFEPCR